MGETDPETDDLRERVDGFLTRNFPQIEMHGGSHSVRNVDTETGEVRIVLGGACRGCGISSVTVQAIKNRIVDEVPEVTDVEAEAGGCETSEPTSEVIQPDFPDEIADDDGSTASF